jgi:D-alanyl-D-alanine carboxypeptidase
MAHTLRLRSVQAPVRHYQQALDVVPALVADAAEPLIEAPAPELTSATAIAVDLTTGDLLYQQGPDETRAPASTVKMLTALTALEVLDADEEVVIEVEDLVDFMVYANAGLQEGDVVTVRDLLAGALVPSGGDAANALAREAGLRLGATADPNPIERFVQEMNSVAEHLGMRNSNFANPDGSDHPDQYTTARDLDDCCLITVFVPGSMSAIVRQKAVLTPIWKTRGCGMSPVSVPWNRARSFRDRQWSIVVVNSGS